MKCGALISVLLITGIATTAEDVPKVIKSAGGIELVLVPAGSFEMGSSRGEDDARRTHKVSVDAFYMDRTEVTQALFDILQVPNPSHFQGTNLPAEQVTWAQAAAFCNARSRAEKLEPCYNEDTGECDFSKNGYRLPTEAEWEYAARAGEKGDYSFGSDERKLADHAWFKLNAAKKTHPVAQRKPNAWGLFDMHGNVAEWCNDIYEKNYYAKSPDKNPRGPTDGKLYVLRGGAWNSSAEAIRVFYRAYENPGFSDACLHRDAIGFRCVRTARQTPAKTGFLYDDIYLAHKTGDGFPERPSRVEAIATRLKDKGLLSQLVRIQSSPAPDEWLATIHSPAYIARVRKACEGLGTHVRDFDSPDVPICAKSFDVATRAAGGVLAAVDAVVEGRARNAFCAVRPPGHHALRDKAMGFCIFNNVAIAARYAQKKYGFQKILIVDWDVHHGNGTEDTFANDTSILYFSTHMHPFYPGTGKESTKTAINVPLAAGAGDEEFRKIYEEKLKPAALAFKPDFIFISAGFDSARGDTLGRLDLTPASYAAMTRVIKQIADECCHGRIISVLEGGYNLDVLADSAESHVRALME